MTTMLFKEEQQFSKNLLWVTVLFIPVLLLVVLFYQLYSGQLVGDYPMSNLSITVLSVIYFIPAILTFYYVRLTTIIDNEKISYGWNVPNNILNHVYFADILEYKIIEYTFIGYGYRISQTYGTVYNLRGKIGLQIIKKSGEKILIGTNKVEELKTALATIENIKAFTPPATAPSK